MRDMTTHHTITYYRVRTAVRFAFAGALTLSAFLVGRAVATDEYAYKCDGSAVVAVHGDTLWSLAEEHCTGHVGSAVDTLYAKHGDLTHGEVVSFAMERK